MFLALKNRLTRTMTACIMVLLIFHFSLTYISYYQVLNADLTEKENFFNAQAVINYETAFDSIEESIKLFFRNVEVSVPSKREIAAGSLRHISSFQHNIAGAFVFSGEEVLLLTEYKYNYLLPYLLQDEAAMQCLNTQDAAWIYLSAAPELSADSNGFLLFVVRKIPDGFRYPVYFAAEVLCTFLSEAAGAVGNPFNEFSQTDFLLDNSSMLRVDLPSSTIQAVTPEDHDKKQYQWTAELKNGIVLKTSQHNSYLIRHMLITLTVVILLFLLTIVIMRLMLLRLNRDIGGALTDLVYHINRYTKTISTRKE